MRFSRTARMFMDLAREVLVLVGLSILTVLEPGRLPSLTAVCAALIVLAGLRTLLLADALHRRAERHRARLIVYDRRDAAGYPWQDV